MPSIGPVFPIRNEDIQPAVAIGIEKCAAGTHGFGQPFLAFASGVVAEGYARLAGHISEAYRLLPFREPGWFLRFATEQAHQAQKRDREWAVSHCYPRDSGAAAAPSIAARLRRL